jgi:alpha-glucosidase
MTDWNPRELTFDLAFLGGGSWDLVSFEDGPNADRNAVDYRRRERVVRPGESLTVRLAPGGGWAGRLSPRTP